jgi:hypothetical protein
MASTITHKRSAIAGKVPTVAQLALGEIAINTRDGKIYIKRDNGTAQVLEIGATGPQGPEGPAGPRGPIGPTQFPLAQPSATTGAVYFNPSDQKLYVYNGDHWGGVRFTNPYLNLVTGLNNNLFANGAVHGDVGIGYTGTTYVPPSTSDNQVVSYRFTNLRATGSVNVMGTVSPTSSTVSGNDRDITITKNGVTIASTGGPYGPYTTVVATSIAPNDVFEWKIRDVYWRYSASGAQADNCKITTGSSLI